MAAGNQLNFTAGGDASELATLQLAPSVLANTTYTLTLNLPQFTQTNGDTWLDISLTAGGSSSNSGYGKGIGGLFIRNNGNSQLNYADGLHGVLTNTQQDSLDTASGTQVTITYDTATGIENFYLGSLTATGTPSYTTTFAAPTGTVYLSMDIFNADGTGDASAATYPIAEVTASAVADTPEPSTCALLLVGTIISGCFLRLQARRLA